MDVDRSLSRQSQVGAALYRKRCETNRSKVNEINSNTEKAPDRSARKNGTQCHIVLVQSRIRRRYRRYLGLKVGVPIQKENLGPKVRGEENGEEVFPPHPTLGSGIAS